MVSDPAAYRWSSFHASAIGARDALVDFHPLYLSLGPSPAERQAAYRALFAQLLDDALLGGLRAATNGGWAFGNDRFKQEIAAMAGRRTAPMPPGRKAKVRDDEGQEILL
jgi:putative transposase